MALYELPAQNPLTRPFRIFSAAAICLILCLLGISLWDPFNLTDPVRQKLGYAAGAIVAIEVIVAYVVSGKFGMWRWKRGFQVELSSGKIALRRPEHTDVEISLTEIQSIREIAGWLLIRGGTPLRGMAIPREIQDYEVLRQELASRHEIVRSRAMAWTFFLPAIVSTLIGISALYLSFSSHNRTVQIASGCILILWFAWGFFVLSKVFRTKKKGVWVLPLYLVTWLYLAWILLKDHIH